MISMITPDKLKDPYINHDADHLADALRYLFNAGYMKRYKQHSYACECKRCNLTHYTSYKRLNCELCGCDTDQFTCTELEE